MNERIKELAEHAGAIEAKNITNIPRALSLNGEEIQKFAELIVRECCDVLQGEDIRYGGYGYNQGFLHKKIKEHFGVEE